MNGVVLFDITDPFDSIDLPTAANGGASIDFTSGTARRGVALEVTDHETLLATGHEFLHATGTVSLLEETVLDADSIGPGYPDSFLDGGSPIEGHAAFVATRQFIGETKGFLLYAPIVFHNMSG